MRKIAIALSKGGVGKSSTAVNLAHGLALAGKRVLLIDTDTQGQLVSFLGRRAEAGLAELILDHADLEEVMVEAREGLWLLAGGRGLAGVKRSIARRDIGGEKTLIEALEPLDERFDFAITDTSPGWDSLTIAALFYSEEILAPVSLEVASLLGLMEFIKTLEDVQKYHRSLRLRYILPTFLDGRVKKSEEVLRQIRDYFASQCCEPIRYSVRLSECVGHGETIFEYAPRSTGAEDYQALVERVRYGREKEDSGRDGIVDVQQDREAESG